MWLLPTPQNASACLLATNGILRVFPLFSVWDGFQNLDYLDIPYVPPKTQRVAIAS